MDTTDVAQMKLFYNKALSSNEVNEVAKAIEQARERAGVKPYESIPI